MLFIHCTISERQRWMVLLSSQSGCYVPSLSSTGDGVNIGTVRQVIPKIRARLLPLVRLVSQRLKRDMKLRQTDMNRVFVTYIILVDSCVKLPDSLHQNLLWKLNWASYWSGSVKSSFECIESSQTTVGQEWHQRCEQAEKRKCQRY